VYLAPKVLSQVLKPGLNTVVVQRPKPSARSTVVIQLSSAPLVQPANPSDQRRLMAVLAELDRRTGTSGIEEKAARG
jgi:hypothetical protein